MGTFSCYLIDSVHPPKFNPYYGYAQVGQFLWYLSSWPCAAFRVACDHCGNAGVKTLIAEGIALGSIDMGNRTLRPFLGTLDRILVQ
jgi:hypothetical protein